MIQTAYIKTKNISQYPRNREQGFTLVECMTVVAIMVIVTAIATPQIMSGRPDKQLKAAARDLYSNMQMAKTIAIRSNSDTAIIFDIANNRYGLCDEWDSSSCAGTLQYTSFTGYGYGIQYGHIPATQTATTLPGTEFGDNVSYNPPDNIVVFNPGAAANSGYVYLNHQDATNTYAVGTHTSGFVVLRRWEGGSWD